MYEYQIWLDDTKYAIVDKEDYEWARQWKWHAMPNSTGKKFYASRMTRDRAAGKQIRLWLHKEILKRARKRKLTKEHSIGDHSNGDSLDNRRKNLWWCTISMNNTRHRQKHVLLQKGYEVD